MQKIIQQKIAQSYNLAYIDKTNLNKDFFSLFALGEGSKMMGSQVSIIKKGILENFERNDIIEKINEFDKLIYKKINAFILDLENEYIIDNSKIEQFKEYLENGLLIKKIYLNEGSSSYKLKTHYDMFFMNINQSYIYKFFGDEAFGAIFDFMEEVFYLIKTKIEEIENEIYIFDTNTSLINKYKSSHLEKIKLISGIDFGKILSNNGNIDLYYGDIYRVIELRQNKIIESKQKVKDLIIEFGGQILDRDIDGFEIEKIINFLEEYLLNEHGWLDCDDMFDIKIKDLRRIIIELKIKEILGKNLPKRIKYNVITLIKKIGNIAMNFVNDSYLIESELEQLLSVSKMNISDLY